MNIFMELAKNFYGITIPRRKKKVFSSLVVEYLNERYTIETAIGMALQRMNLSN